MSDGGTFAWSDGPQSLVIEAGSLERAVDLLAGRGFSAYELVTSPRALGDALPELASQAAAVHEIGPGAVPELSAGLLDAVGEGARLVALGGGRPIDTAKAVAAVRGGAVAAIPTTLSGAPFTSIHRLPAGVTDRPLVRAELVVFDPSLLATIGEADLRATAGNALAHGIDALFGPNADGESARRAISGAGLIAGALDSGRADRDLTALAYGAALCALAIERAGLALQHVLAQSAVRVLGTSHAETHSAILPCSLAASAGSAPEAVAGLATVLGVPAARLGDRIRELAGSYSLGGLGADRDDLEALIATATRRLDLMPGEWPGPSGLEAILDAAW